MPEGAVGGASVNLEPAYVLAYRLFGNVSERLTERFPWLAELVRRAYLGVGPSSYISLFLLTGVLSSSVAFVATLTLSLLLAHMAILGALFFSALAFGGAWLMVFLIFYGYPSLRMRRMRAELERDMPFIASYMAVMASAGVNPYEIFRSLARGDIIPSITPIARTIVRDVELLGFDALSAILRAAQLSPSNRLRAFLDGIVSTIYTGGDLGDYLRGATEEALRIQRVKLRETAETLSVFGEAFVALFVAGPIFLTVMLALMALLGGVGGLLGPLGLLQLMIYFFLPIGGVSMLIIAKALMPGE